MTIDFKKQFSNGTLKLLAEHIFQENIEIADSIDRDMSIRAMFHVVEAHIKDNIEAFDFHPEASQRLGNALRDTFDLIRSADRCLAGQVSNLYHMLTSAYTKCENENKTPVLRFDSLVELYASGRIDHREEKRFLENHIFYVNGNDSYQLIFDADLMANTPIETQKIWFQKLIELAHNTRSFTTYNWIEENFIELTKYAIEKDLKELAYELMMYTLGTPVKAPDGNDDSDDYDLRLISYIDPKEIKGLDSELLSRLRCLFFNTEAEFEKRFKTAEMLDLVQDRTYWKGAIMDMGHTEEPGLAQISFG